MSTKLTNTRWLYLIVFLIAFIPRVWALDAYVAPDEGKWIFRSAHFLQALLHGDLAKMTSVAATPDVEVLAPAVPTMWTGALGLTAKYWATDQPERPATLSDFLAAIPQSTEKIPLDFYSWVRFPTVLLTSLSVTLFFYLLAQLIQREIALLAALLLALDPFFIGLSRVIHHDALVSIFILISLLALLIYGQPNMNKGHRWLLMSGMSGGLALLTKPTALYLVIFVAIFLLFAAGWPRTLETWRRSISIGLVWGLIAFLTFILIWPALWVAPLATFADLFDRATNALGGSNDYTLLPGPGTFLPELGFLFYPVNWLFKTTLPILLGLGILAVGCWRNWFKSDLWAIKWLTVFALLFLFLLIPADTRDIRYFLPANLVLHGLAAIGLSALAGWLGVGDAKNTPHPQPLSPKERVRVRGVFFIPFLLLYQLALALIYAPYYTSYWNPVMAGPWLAPRLVKIGSGEGLDQAGRYLAQKPNAANLIVATSFWESFVPFFPGGYTKAHYDDEADYILIYRRQVQNNNPFPEYWTYFAARPAEYTVSLVGLDYAWLYPGPQLRVVRDAEFVDGLKLGGYRLAQPVAQPGQAANLTLVWSGNVPAQSDATVTVQLRDAAEQPWLESSGPLLAPAGPSPIEGHYSLMVPAEMPRGDYELWVSIDDADHHVGYIPVRQWVQPVAELSFSENFGEMLTLGGASLNYEAETAVLNAEFVWQARWPMHQSFTNFVHVVDATGAIWGQSDRIPLDGQLPTLAWDQNEWIVDTFQLSLKSDTPPGTYTILTGWYDPTTFERLPVVGGDEGQTVVAVGSIEVR